MRINTRFAVAVHMLALIELNKTQSTTSDLMALSVGTNPVVIRQVMTSLKRAGLIESQGGVPGSRLSKPQEEIRSCIHRRGMPDGRGIFAPVKANFRRNKDCGMTASSGHTQFNFAQPLDVAVAKSWMYFKKI